MKTAKRSHKIAELKEKTESKCKWGLFSVFESSCQGHRASRKLISNGRTPSNQQQIIEYPRKSDQFTRFDEECQRFQSEAYLPVEKLTNKEPKSKRESESELCYSPMESQRKGTSKAHRRKSFAMGETSLNEDTLAEVLRTEPRNSNNSAEPTMMSEGLTRSFSARKYSNVDEINSTNQVVRMNVKAFVDQMFIERRLKDRLNSECRSFSDALEVLSSAKNLHARRKQREALKVGTAEEDWSKKSSFAARPGDDEIVVTKPKSQNPKYSKDVAFHHSDSCVQARESDAFSIKKVKKRLKQRFIGPKGPGLFLTCGDSSVLPQNGSSVTEVGNKLLIYGSEIKSNVDVKAKDKLWKRPDIKKQGFREFDVILEAKRHLSSRLENASALECDGACKRTPRTLGRILLSPPERDFRSLGLSPRKESDVFSGSAEMRYSLNLPKVSKISFQKQIERHRLSRTNTEVLDREEISLPIPRTGDESHDDTNTGESKTVVTKSTRRQESYDSEAVTEINSSDYTQNCSRGHSISGSVSEHEASTSSASITPHLDIAESIKYQEEHQSPVSVLEPIFTDEANSPPRTASHTDKQELQPLRLDFEEQAYDSIPRDHRPISSEDYYCIEDQYIISHYVQSVLQASFLNWDYLSRIDLLPEETELVAESLFDEVELPLIDHCYVDRKLLFDRINEVLLRLHEAYCCSPSWLAFKKQRIRQVELEKVVIDEVMNEAEFFLLPTTERRTLDQLVSKDVRKCTSWLDVTRDREQILIDISDHVLEESIVDMLLGFE